MKKYRMELIMACLMLVSFYLLSRQAAVVSVSSKKVPKGQEKGVIVIDAGHGGEDPGMIGIKNLEEKGINLQIAKKLCAHLEKEGYTVVMTREKDQGLYGESRNNRKAQDMQKRIRIIKETTPLLTVSIHQNSYQDPEVKGPQVFYYQDSTEGQKLAQILQTELNQQMTVDRPREAKGNKTYYLLKRSEGILTIIECGFLTNPEEAKLLVQEEYQEKLAEAIADGIIRYLEESPARGVQSEQNKI